jgi:hypothetical protein
MVYLAGLLGGALHHHGHRCADTTFDATPLVAIDSPVSSEAIGDDDHDCAMCAAIHQAKTPPPALVLVERHGPTSDGVADDYDRAPIFFPTRSSARGPPA